MEKLSCCFPQQLHHLHSAMHRGCSYFTSSPTLIYLFIYFDNHHLNGYELVSHFSFDLHFLNDQWCWISFHVLIGHLYIFFVEMSIEVFVLKNFSLCFAVGNEGLLACQLLPSIPCLLHFRVHGDMLALWFRSSCSTLPDYLLYQCQKVMEGS